MELNKYVDHTLLKPDATQKQIKKICDEAKEYKFAAVCVNPYYTSFVAKELEGTKIRTCTVVGFPLGANTTEVKALEAKNAVENGAQEIDMVINIGALKDKKIDLVKKDINDVVQAVKGRAIVKVIIECCLLTDEEKKTACKLAIEAGANFVKTSTGFSSGGATESDIKLMKSIIGDNAKVKASGGIRDYDTAKKMIKAGADRIGTSSGIEIMNKLN